MGYNGGALVYDDGPREVRIGTVIDGIMYE